MTPLLGSVAGVRGSVSPSHSNSASSPRTSPNQMLPSPDIADSVATTAEVSLLSPDNNANTNPFFSSPEIRAFLFGTSDSLLGDYSSSFPANQLANNSSKVQRNSSIGSKHSNNKLIMQTQSSHPQTSLYLHHRAQSMTTSTSSHASLELGHAHSLELDLDSPLYQESSVDSPMDVSPSVDTPRAPIASCEEDDDLSSYGVSWLFIVASECCRILLAAGIPLHDASTGC